MSNVYQVVIRMEAHGGFPVEIHLGTDDPASVISPESVQLTIKSFQEKGFSAPPRFSKAGGNGDNMGKIGEVRGAPVYDSERKLWAYTAVLSDASEFKFNDFSRTAYRPGDVIRVVKNDRGFKTAEVLDPDSKEVQEYRAGQPNKNEADDIPF